MKNQLENSRIKTYLSEGKETYRLLVENHTHFEDAVKLRDEVCQKGYHEAFVVPGR